MKYLTNTVKEKLNTGQLVLGSWISLPSLESVEIMCMSQAFDFLVIDAEHSPIHLETIQKMNMVIEGHGIFPFVRVSNNDPVTIKRTLETGCYGIIVPDISSKYEAQASIKNILYKPKGNRGVGLSRAQGYGMNFGDYLSWLEHNLCIIVQIEDIHAIQNLREILDNDSIDASMIGPYDLSASLGCAGDLSNDRVIGALEEYESVSTEMNKPYGYHITHSNEGLLRDKSSKGYSFLVYGVDQIMLAEKCEQSRSAINEIRRDHSCEI